MFSSFFDLAVYVPPGTSHRLGHFHVSMLKENMGRFLICICVVMISILASCATAPPERLDLSEVLDGEAAITIPMKVTESGLIVIKGIKAEGQSLDMVLDTGATQSAIFRSALNKLNLEPSFRQETMVHGMVESKEHKVVYLPMLDMGPLSFTSKPMIVLDDRESDFRDLEIFDGLIGMDILAKYQVYVSPSKSELKLIPNDVPVYVSYFWPRIYLRENPFLSDDRTLHFIEMRIAGRMTPALFDTGAEFSAMNWPAATYAQAKAIRRNLRKEWELQGAVGIFKPVARVKLNRLRGGQIFWNDKEFVVMDFDSLDVLGVENQPFIIAGMNLFLNETIFMDFERGFLAVIPEEGIRENPERQ